MLKRFLSGMVLDLYRQEYFEGCPLAQFSKKLQGAFMSLYDAKNCRHSQTTPVKLGGIERLENPIIGLYAHAATGICNFQVDIATGGDDLAEIVLFCPIFVKDLL